MRVLTAILRKSIGGASLRSSLAFGQRVSVHAIARRGLLYDSRLMPRVEVPEDVAVIYLLIAGRLRFLEGTERTHLGPAALVFSQRQFEGAEDEPPLAFITDQTPYRAIDVRVPMDCLKGGSAPTPYELTLPPAVWLRASELDAADDRDRVKSGAHALLEEFVKSGTLTEGVTRAAAASAPARQLWSGLVAFFERSELMPTLAELADLSGVSLRQTSRVLDALFDSLPFAHGQWRQVTHRYRLKIAALALSTDAAISDVAKATGYGSSEAMARAFRSARLPSPSEVQAALRDQRRG